MLAERSFEAFPASRLATAAVMARLSRITGTSRLGVLFATEFHPGVRPGLRQTMRKVGHVSGLSQPRRPCRKRLTGCGRTDLRSSFTPSQVLLRIFTRKASRRPNRFVGQCHDRLVFQQLPALKSHRRRISDLRSGFAVLRFTEIKCRQVGYLGQS